MGGFILQPCVYKMELPNCWCNPEVAGTGELDMEASGPVTQSRCWGEGGRRKKAQKNKKAELCKRAEHFA